MALELIDIGPKSLDGYETLIGGQALAELRDLARPLRGARLLHLNSTPYGGGVAELLRSLIPLYRTLGVQADWRIIPGDPGFFGVTKKFHNALQGADLELTRQTRDVFLGWNGHIAALFDGSYDYVVVHDPQPVPLLSLHGRDGAKWVWRCHVDSSSPNDAVMEILSPFIAEYDTRVFTMEEYVPEGLRDLPYVVTPPGIDPLSPKNMTLPQDLSSQIVEWTGVHLDRHLVTQVSRFDPWKDPLGVIEVWRQVRDQMPGTQLALLGSMALDDPQGWDFYHAILADVEGDPDIHVLTNLTGISNVEVNAFQSRSNVVIQKSVREGFGLVVSEALWKGTPVVATRVGGIPQQMPDGVGGHLVGTMEECVEAILALLQDPHEAQELGTKGRARVRDRYLITRLLADELRTLTDL